MDTRPRPRTLALRRDGVTLATVEPAEMVAAVELERLVHEINPEQPDDYVVRLDLVDIDTHIEAAVVAFNVRVRTRAPH